MIANGGDGESEPRRFPYQSLFSSPHRNLRCSAQSGIGKRRSLDIDLRIAQTLLEQDQPYIELGGDYFIERQQKDAYQRRPRVLVPSSTLPTYFFFSLTFFSLTFFSVPDKHNQWVCTECLLSIAAVGNPRFIPYVVDSNNGEEFRNSPGVQVWHFIITGIQHDIDKNMDVRF